MRSTTWMPLALALASGCIIVREQPGGPHKGDVVEGCDFDRDCDGLKDEDEPDLQGDPADPDTDDDGLDDRDEVDDTNTDPTNPDTDGDGLGDGQEDGPIGTDPNDVD